MIEFKSYILPNGLKVILHKDDTSQMAVVNTLYNVGARDEEPEMTGMAHLFEHLMFSGSKHVEDFDDLVQHAGGDNNAYTTNDITNYFISVPYQNLEMALWIEADRMHLLNLDQNALDVQKKVVIEEFNEMYINKPYGDAWKHLRDLSYTDHPYRWMTIGRRIEDIERVTLEDAISFYKKFYSPKNAILCIAGHIDEEQTIRWCHQYFGDIEGFTPVPAKPLYEPQQMSARERTVYGAVPQDAFWIAYHMPARLDKGYYMADIITDILGSGKTALLYQEFVKTRQLLTEVSCYHTGSADIGLLVIEGKVTAGGHLESAVSEIQSFLDGFRKNTITLTELQRIKNRIESFIHFEDIQLLNRANNLAFYEWLGDAHIVNQELEQYMTVDLDELNQFKADFLKGERANTLLYKKDSTTAS